MKVSSKSPVIFNFQVTEVKQVKTAAKLKEWETLMQKRVGIKIDPGSIAAGSATTSCCPDCDDCDMA